MGGIIPIIRVNYTFYEVLRSIFIPARSRRYRNKLKEAIKDLYGVNDVLLTSSCREAIYMLLKSLKQNKVIIPAYTCDVVVDAALSAGKTIQFAKVSRDTMNIEAYPAFDSDTILIATHQFGYPCEIDNIVAECHNKGAIVIEDCAGAFGSKYKRRYVGTFGDFGVFSFNSSKTITSPSGGGAVIARDPERLKGVVFRQNSEVCFYSFKKWVKSIGLALNNNSLFHYLLYRLFNVPKEPVIEEVNEVNKRIDYPYELLEWQSYITYNQLKQWNELEIKRKNLFKRYCNELKTPVIHIIKGAECVCNRYATFVKNRDAFIKYCSLHGVGIGYGFERVVIPNEFECERDIAADIVYLPFSCNYSTKEIDHIISIVNEAYEKVES